MLRQPSGEPEFLASRPLDAAEPMIQWGDAPDEEVPESWFL